MKLGTYIIFNVSVIRGMLSKDNKVLPFTSVKKITDKGIFHYTDAIESDET